MDSTSDYNKPRRRKGNYSRLIISAIFVLFQIVFLIWAFFSLNIFALTSYIIIQFLTAMTALNIVVDKRKASYKIAWITVLIIIPIFGLICYLMWGQPRQSKVLKRRIPIISEMTIPLYKWNPQTRSRLVEQYPEMERRMVHLNKAGFPIYENTATKYFATGDEYFTALFNDIKKAEKFIFLEYFIVSSGNILDELMEILSEKARDGVEIKLLYDDMGCISTLPKNFPARMKQYGIQAATFNKARPFVNNFYLNYRNHQKICVIDGNIAYTGGVNIADEYANLVEAFGHWKDSGIRLEGDAVWSMTIMFLQMWQYARDKNEMISYRDKLHEYAPKPPFHGEKAGFVQPFCNGPCNQTVNNTAEHMYMQMINSARNYIFITTPYLVLDNEMQTALIIAAQSGVDVRIITPSIPDKKYVYLVTNSHYGRLLEAGVKIYEYTPGFIHAKNLVTDDTSAIVGTINMDFRSFFLHYENAVWLCGTQSVSDIKSDFLQTLALSKQIEYNNWKKRPIFMKIKQRFLNFFSPML